jgi:hypothetical protein
VERIVDSGCFPDKLGVQGRERGFSTHDHRRLVKSPLFFDGPPDVTRDARPGIGGKSTSARVIAQDRTPQTDTTGLDCLVVWQITQDLLAHDGVNQSVVLFHEFVQAITASGLCLTKLCSPGLYLCRRLG